MKNPPYKIEVDETIIEIKPKNNVNFTIEEMRELINGDIKTIYKDEELAIVYNEDGMKNGLAMNPIATSFGASVMKPEEYIAGDALVIPRRNLKSS